MNVRQWIRGMAVLFTGLIMSSVLDLSAHAAVIGSVREGKIVVTGEGDEVIGLDIASLGGYLVPVSIASGALAASADPFMFFLKNEPDQVILVTLGTPLTLDGALVTAIGYAPPPGTDIAADLINSAYGEPLAEVPTPLVFVVPEPATALLAFIGVLGLLGFRQRGKSRLG